MPLRSLLSHAPGAQAHEAAEAFFLANQNIFFCKLVLELPGRCSAWAIEIKRSLSPRLGKGFHHARDDVRPERTFVVCAGEDRYPISEEAEVIGLRELAALIGAA